MYSNTNPTWPTTAAKIALICITNAAFAAEFPDIGIAFSIKDAAILEYRCQKQSDEILTCDFTQTLVKKRAKPSDLIERMAAAKKQFVEAKPFLTAQCKSISESMSIMKGQRKPTDESESRLLALYAKASVAERSDIETSTDAMADYCQDSSEENYLKVVRATAEKDTRTCNVRSRSLHQNFGFLRDDATGQGVWAVRSEPQGPCGVVTLSKFEPETVPGASFMFWKYIEKKIVTNPSETSVSGTGCKDLSQDESIYDWRSTDHFLQCDYIDFRPF